MSIPLLLGGVFDTKTNFILAAAGVCAIMAITLILLGRNMDHATDEQRKRAGFWTALVAGVGVWATHFVAMLGYRPDAALTYDLETTLLSILAGFVFVGLPLGAALQTWAQKHLAALGAIAGAGVAVMHLTGMSAIENCVTAYNAPILIAAVFLGMAGFAFALRQTEATLQSYALRGAGIVAGVCVLHFTAMSSATLQRTVAGGSGLSNEALSIMISITSIAVFAITVNMTFQQRRILAQRGSDSAAA
ncbi:MHYT domain-containing protein, NO-binding membrane sensor [Palleronia salina]|uniref:MHYT domain-containing protein, NO-binding membrane sensor n=1 Tax=Palleronia salina TaxID=313368 RepID=A0A1M6KM03_9RHOB|nr:MHYT domain-containing protein [Palleronia salina]SHJ59957.1 MHYT domain-containing protein, NO-binding membrane sensor [Palleronia salina]